MDNDDRPAAPMQPTPDLLQAAINAHSTFVWSNAARLLCGQPINEVYEKRIKELAAAIAATQQDGGAV